MNSSAFSLRTHLSVLAILFLFFLSTSIAQMRIKGEVFYDEVGSPNAKVKLFKDNKLDQEFETNKKGKFSVMLAVGHDFLFEVSKDYHYTTRFIVSTKLPYEKNKDDFYASFDVVLDLIRIYEGLNASIMDNPIMILRNLPEGGFGFDEDHLNAVRDRVDRLMNESERLKSKGSKALVKPPVVAPKKAEPKEIPKVEQKDEVVEESMEITTTHSETEVKSEIVQKPSDKEREDTKLVTPPKKESERTNESYEMKLRRERIEREQQRKENLALKRGYETSLIRQVAEESKRLSRSEYDSKKKEKTDSSFYEIERKENELRKYKTEQKKKLDAQLIAKTENQKQKQQFEKGLIKDVAASKRGIVSIKEGEKTKGEQTEDGEKFYLEPKVYETTKEDKFKSIRTIHVDYPSNSTLLSVEEYSFGMLNYYIDGSVVEKSKFCSQAKELELTKYKLPCD